MRTALATADGDGNTVPPSREVADYQEGVDDAIERIRRLRGERREPPHVEPEDGRWPRL